MNRSTIVHVLLLLSVAAAALAAEPPNVVFIMADDLGIGDVNCFGGERCQIPTPNFDRLAREGMRFTDAHALASHCVPTRVAIMSGRYPWRFQRPQISGPWGFLNPRMPTEHFTLGRLMHRAGYRTGYIGKWHLGTVMQTHDGRNQNRDNVDYTKPLKVGPPQYGFDFSFVLPGSLDMYPYVFVRNNEFVGSVTARKGWSAFNRVGPADVDFEDDQVLDRFCREAEDFIGRQAETTKRGTPFFLYFALTSPHTPTSPRAEFHGKSGLGLYGDFVMETDDCVGRVLAALEAHDLARNTLVIATSDHGAALYAGNIRKATPNQLRELEKQGHYSSGVYRGYKFSAYEGGLRVPFVVRWPGVVTPGTRCDDLIALADLMRTFADVAGQPLGEQEAPDSVSFLPLLKSPAGPKAREALVMQSINSFVIRWGKWKLAICPGSGCEGRYGNVPRRADAWKNALETYGRNPRNREELKQAPFVQLFDLDADPGENKNLAEKRPHLVADLFALLDRQIMDGRSTVGPKLSNDRSRINYFSSVPDFVLAKQQ